MQHPFNLFGCVLALIATAPVFASGVPAPNIAGETLEQVAVRTGCTATGLRHFFPTVSSISTPTIWSPSDSTHRPRSAFTTPGLVRTAAVP